MEENKEVLNEKENSEQLQDNNQNNKEHEQQDNNDKKNNFKSIIATTICILLFIIILLLMILLGLKKCSKYNNESISSSGEPTPSIKYDYDADKVDILFKKLVSNQMLVDGFDEDPLTKVIAATYSDNQASFNLNIEVRSETKVYYYRLSNHPYNGFDSFIPYLLSLDLDTKKSLNDGTIHLDTYYPSLETITTDKESYKYLISTDYSGTSKYFSGFYYDNNEYHAYIHKELTSNPFNDNADLIIGLDSPLYTYYQKLNA